MKKILSITLVLAMLLSLPITVMAADSEKTPTPVEITPVNMAFLNGGLFYQYDPSAFIGKTGSTSSFVCDGEFFTMNPDAKNPVTGAAPGYAMLQYRHAMKGDYALTYQVKLNANNKDRLYTWFYWQDYTQNGRSYQTSQRGIGFSLKMEANDGNLTLGVVAAEKKQGGGSSVAATSGNATSEILKDAAANALLNVSLKWEGNKLTAKVSLASDASKTTGDVVFDLSGQTDILGAINEPAGFGFLFAPSELKETVSSSVGHMAYTDLTVKDAQPVEIALVNMAFLNGNQFYQYDPQSFIGKTGSTSSFVCDGEFFTMNPDGKNPVTGAASTYAMLQYRHAMKGDYDLSYQVKLNANNKDRLYTWFYWQDYTQNGRSYQTSQRGIGFSLKMEANDGNLTLGVVAAEKKQGGGSSVAATSGNATSEILKDAAANALLNVSMKWAGNKLTVKVSLASDASKTTGDVVFDLSGQTDILGAINEPAGFGFLFAPSEVKETASSSIGHISYTDYGADDTPAVDPDYNFIAVDNSFVTLPDGDKFVRGTDGWFTRGNGAVASNNAVIASKHATSYNYKLSFKMKLNAENRGRVGVWNIWDGKFSGSHYGYMFNLQALEGGALEYRLARYEGGYSSGNGLVTSETQANTQGVKLLEGQAANAELLITITVQDRTLSVDVCLANDTSKKAGTVTYDFSAGTERTINRVADRTLGFAIMDMAGQEGLVSSSYGAVTYTALPGEAPKDEDVDQNDYNKILSNNDYKWNGNVNVTEENFLLYNFDGLSQYEKFAIENGWLTRKNADGLTNSEDANVRVNAYAIAQYKGKMAEGDYKLTFKVKADADNHFRFSVLTRWEDKDDTSSIKFKSQQGYRIYFETTSENMLSIFCYRTVGGRMAPLPATAANATALSLEGIAAGTLEIEVTLVMKGDLIVAEAHLAGDANKSTGPVAFDMSDDVNLLGQIDRTQGFALIDSANESKFAPASFGEFKIYAASEPTVGDKKNDDDDPDKNITTEDPNKDTSKPGDDTKAPSGDTSAETDAPSEDKKGCQSGISVVPFAAVLVLSAAAVMIGKKRKQD